jgi:hypothetical protein
MSNDLKSIHLSERTWSIIYANLAREHKVSVILIRSRMKSVLGFTARRHTEWIDNVPITHIVLDFYNPAKRTMFLLKFSELLDKNKLT